MKKFFGLLLTYLVLSSCIIAEATTLFTSHLTFANVKSEKLDILDNNKKEESLKNKTVELSSKKTVNNPKDNIEVFNHKGSVLKITKSDIDLLAKLVYCESRGEPFKGKVAVVSVVLNRVMSPKFPNTIEGVIFQKNAFSCVRNGTLIAQPNKSCYDAVYEAIRGKDPTNEALFFYNPTIATCSWMKETSKKDSKKIGNHTFFKQ